MSALQAFLISACSALVLSSPFVYLVWQQNQDFRLTSRDPGLPIQAGLLLVLGFMPPLLGYYHVGRMGALAGIAMGLTFFFAVGLTGRLLFNPFFGHGMAPTRFIALLTAFALGLYGVANSKLARSRHVLEAQRKLGLTQSNKNLTTAH